LKLLLSHSWTFAILTGSLQELVGQWSQKFIFLACCSKCVL